MVKPEEKMRNVMCIFLLLILFSEARSLDTGTNESTPVNPSMNSRPPVIEYRNLTFKLGSEVNLTCSQKTWNETIYVIWKLHLKNRDCEISTSKKTSLDYCKDGKSLRNTSGTQLYLHIPNVSPEDMGTYNCESVYTGGQEVHIITVAITVPPVTDAWLEHRDNKMVAVCRAERGNPAANISWSHAGNKLSNETPQQPVASDGLFTVESRLELPQDVSPANLTCEVRHPFWAQTQSLVPKLRKAEFPWLYLVVGVIIVVILMGFILFVLNKRIALRRCQQPDIPSSKLSRSEEVEEVEPYASYVQRVNSIYNSSADLFA